MMRRMLLTLLLSVSTQLWAAEPRELTWNDMIPPDAPVVKPVTAPIHDMSKLSDALAMEAAPAAHQLAPHAPVVKALDGKLVRLPGYIVPLEVSEEGRVTEFLLVPYFGACIHTPPPPANQIVHVVAADTVKGLHAMDTVRVSGLLKAARYSSVDMGVSGYEIKSASVEPFVAAR